MNAIADWCAAVRQAQEELEKKHNRATAYNANRKWRENNREYYNAYHRAYYKKRMYDPEFRANRRAYQREYYHRRKAEIA